MRTIFAMLACIVSCAIWCVLPCAGAAVEISSQATGVSAAAVAPAMIYVKDFELDAANIQADRGMLARGPLATLRPGPLGAKDPKVRAEELIDLMSNSLVSDLKDKGFNARRLMKWEATPGGGWLVRGVFTEVDEGNRVRRAVIGFGHGETDLRLTVAVDDLGQGMPKPLYELAEGTESNKMPGAAITLNPYVAAAKFILAGRDLDRNVREAASKIAGDIAARVKK